MNILAVPIFITSNNISSSPFTQVGYAYTLNGRIYSYYYTRSLCICTIVKDVAFLYLPKHQQKYSYCKKMKLARGKINKQNEYNTISVYSECGVSVYEAYDKLNDKLLNMLGNLFHLWNGSVDVDMPWLLKGQFYTISRYLSIILVGGNEVGWRVLITRTFIFTRKQNIYEVRIFPSLACTHSYHKRGRFFLYCLCVGMSHSCMLHAHKLYWMNYVSSVTFRSRDFISIQNRDMVIFGLQFWTKCTCMRNGSTRMLKKKWYIPMWYKNVISYVRVYTDGDVPLVLYKLKSRDVQQTWDSCQLILVQ